MGADTNAAACGVSTTDSCSRQKLAMWCVEEIPTSRKNAPAAPQLSPPVVVASGTPCAELTLHQSGGLQGRRDDRAGCNARRCAGQRFGNLRNRETCGLEGRRDHVVRVERVTRLPFFTLSKRSFSRTMRSFGGCSSDDNGAAISWT